MKSIQPILCLLLLLLCNMLNGQGDRGLTNGTSPPSSKCKACNEAIANKPQEVLFGLQSNAAGEVYFVCTDKDWFVNFFNKSNVGIGVDVIDKSQYPCDAENIFPKSTVRKGELLPPIYFKDFKKKIFENDGLVMVRVGELSADMMAKAYELSLQFLRGSVMCYYQHFYNLDVQRWELLDTGLYMDTIAGISPEAELSDLPKETNILLSKRMKFEFPFEKGKAEYSPADIQPLYDSLRLTDFHILSAEVMAYSSVEGSTARNIELQQNRATSIVDALNSFQDKKFEAKVACAENWVEFINDMERAGRRDLASLSQEEIKARLNKGGLSKELEPFLQAHRKAILVLELQKKTKYTEMDNLAILSLYEETLADKNIETAIKIQQELFARVSESNMNPSEITEVQIPKQIEYGALLNNQSVFDYSLDKENVLQSLLAFKELDYLIPKDKHLKYNICVLETKAWLVGQSTVDPEKLLKDISALINLGIERRIVNKLKVNYYIIASEYHMLNRNYAAKDESLEFIYKKYRSLKLNDIDLVSLSKYFSSYARYDWAQRVIKSKTTKLDVHEDLLFYYLNLTIIDEKTVNKSSYRSTLINAFNKNNERFCDLFEPISEGGIGLSLLNNSKVKSTYCEVCK